ncbi:MAG: hypothetical protein C4294_20075 [Nitrospiraceae bacterium]
MWGRAASLTEAKKQLVLANRILVRLGLLDSMGHVSVRNPEDPSTYLLSWAKAPRWVSEEAVLVFDPDREERSQTGKPAYVERALHGVYRARPDVHAIVHMPSVLPFGLMGRPVRAVIHSAPRPCSGGTSRARGLLRAARGGVYIISQEQARRMPVCLGSHRSVLGRGHGCVVMWDPLSRNWW